MLVQLEKFMWFVGPSSQPGAADLEVGDRIVGIVMCRRMAGAPLRPEVAIFEATETGWHNEHGFSPEECEIWTHEPLLANAAMAAIEKAKNR